MWLMRQHAVMCTSLAMVDALHDQIIVRGANGSGAAKKNLRRDDCIFSVLALMS
jgi:hypothetical protein